MLVKSLGVNTARNFLGSVKLSVKGNAGEYRRRATALMAVCSQPV
jgi:hypothetical protein